MGIGSFISRIFKRQPPPVAPTEVIAERSVQVFAQQPTEPIDNNRLLVEFRDQLSTQAESQKQLTTLLTSLSKTLDALPQLARQQGQVLETLLENSARSRQRDQTFERGLTQLTEGSHQQTQVLGLVQQQLDLNHEVSLRVAESLRETAGALSTFAATSDRQSRAIENLALSTQRRVAQSDRLEKAIQFWLFVVAGICTLALVYAIWAASRGPMIIAYPPAPVAAPAPIAVPAPIAAPAPVVAPAPIAEPAPIAVPAPITEPASQTP